MKRQKVRKAFIFISLLMFPITMNFLSPYVIIDGAAQGVIAGSFIMFGILFLASLVLGRAFCGWVCPVAGLQEICFGVNNNKVRGKAVKRIKYFIWVPWLSGIVFAAVAAGGIKEVNFLYLTESGISVDMPVKYVVYYSVIALFMILSITVGRRAACHSICWMAPFMVIGGRIRGFLKIPGLRLKVVNHQCTSCKACEAKCPMSLEVNSMAERANMTNDECILCGECVDVCPKKVIRYDLGKK